MLSVARSSSATSRQVVVRALRRTDDVAVEERSPAEIRSMIRRIKRNREQARMAGRPVDRFDAAIQRWERALDIWRQGKSVHISYLPRLDTSRTHLAASASVAHAAAVPGRRVTTTPREHRAAPRRARSTARAPDGDDPPPRPLAAGPGCGPVRIVPRDGGLSPLGKDVTPTCCSPDEAARGLRRAVEGVPPSTAVALVLPASTDVRNAFLKAMRR
jgi:hypothetical protein